MFWVTWRHFLVSTCSNIMLF